MTRVVWRREHTPGLKPRCVGEKRGQGDPRRPKAKALGYLEAKAKTDS
jgi:hypothetical protein